MNTFRLKHIGLAVCLMASLLVGSASACMCSHHEVKKQEVKTSCHRVVHETTETAETLPSGDSVNVDCVCFVNQSAPYVVTKSESKKAKPVKDKDVSSPFTTVAVDLCAFADLSPLPVFDSELSYSYLLKSLLPSRAPPRL